MCPIRLLKGQIHLAPLNSLDDSWTAPQSHGIENIRERLSQHHKHAGISGGGGQNYKLAQHIAA